MLKILSGIFFFTALALALLPPGMVAQGSVPSVVPSAYFVLPGQTLTISASGFPPDATLRIDASGTEIVSLHPGTSSVTTLIAPYRTESLNITAPGVSRRVVIGEFYPVVEPDSYFVPRGGQVSFTGRDFAPGEAVAILWSGEELARANTDASGRFSAGPFLLPPVGGDHHFRFEGVLSGASYAVRVHAAAYDPWIVLDSYYASPGSGVKISGSAFAAGEAVEVRFDGTRVSAGSADAVGMFSLTFIVPPGPAGETVVTAWGLQSGVAAETGFTRSQ